jgi:hypothetical protein
MRAADAQNWAYFVNHRQVAAAAANEKLRVRVGSGQLVLAGVRCLQQVELTAALRPPRRAFPAGASATAAVVALMFDEMLSYVNVGCARLHPILA